MCGICGMLWILLQLEQQIQLAFRMFPHIDHSNGSCNKTATPIPIDIIYMHVPSLLYCTKLNSSFKSDLSDVLLYWRNLYSPNCYQCIMLLTTASLKFDLTSCSGIRNTTSWKCFYAGICYITIWFLLWRCNDWPLIRYSPGFVL